MAIRIPILTSFDPKGLKQANAQFAKLQTSMGSLGRNFAIAGIAITAAFAAIGRSVADAAESQKVFAQTEAVLKSMGTTANGTATDLANMASALQKTTAFSDEAILAGANLLLTFKNIQNQAGAGNDIFDQTATLMLDVARAMGTSASGEAIRLGKALNDPVKGISALTRVGIQFTDQQKAQIKALAESGDLMGAQKIILAELQQQFGGSAAAYAGTFAGQVESLNNDLNDLSEEIGFMVMPAIKELVSEFRDLIPVIGPQLKAAIESVNIPALVTNVVNLTKFIVENATTIANLVIGIFALNTAFKLMQVAIGIGNVAIALKTWYVAQLTTGMTFATIAAAKLRTALLLVGVAGAVAAVVTEYVRLKGAVEKSTTALSDFDTEVVAVSGAASKLNPINTIWQKITYSILGAITAQKEFNGLPAVKTVDPRTGSNYAQGFRDRLARQSADSALNMNLTPDLATGGAGASQAQTVSQVLKREGVLATRETKLLTAGVSEGFADLILNTATTKKAFQKELAKISSPEGLKRAQARFNKTTAGQAEIAQNAAAAAQAAAQAAAELAAAQAESARKEAEVIAERERIYQSFADSVKNTFAGIKNSIMGAFDLTQLGGSTNAITRNMEKLLVKLRSFATNVKSLATMGLNPALLQQIISAGPMAGARLAESLAMGGAAGLSAINAGYSEFGALSGQIAQTGTESLFGSGQQQTVYNINVDGGVGSGSTIGKAIVDAIKAYERTSGAVWQGA
jgi:hypothetical protein